MNGRGGIGFHHVTVVLMLLIGVYFAAQLSTTAVLNTRLAAREHDMDATVGSLKAANQSLQTDLAYYNSDQYVEYAARNQLGLMRAGDHVLKVVAIAPRATPGVHEVAAPSATATATPTATPSPRDNDPYWRRWLRLFQ